MTMIVLIVHIIARIAATAVRGTRRQTSVHERRPAAVPGADTGDETRESRPAKSTRLWSLGILNDDAARSASEPHPSPLPTIHAQRLRS